MKTRSGFTIIELLTAITIIVILAGLIVGGARKAREMALIDRAKADIAVLETFGPQDQIQLWITLMI